MNREVNKGVELNRQKDMIPVMALSDDTDNELKKDTLNKYISRELNADEKDILDYDMFYIRLRHRVV